MPDSEPERVANSHIRGLLKNGSDQNTPRAVIDARDAGLELTALLSFQHEAGTNSLPIIQGLPALTPSASCPIPEPAPPISALSQLRDYSSIIEDSVDESSASTSHVLNLHPQPRSPSQTSQSFPLPLSLKRPREAIIGDRHAFVAQDSHIAISEEMSLKRSRTESELPIPNEPSNDLSANYVGSVGIARRTCLERPEPNLPHISQTPVPVMGTRLISFLEPTIRVMSPDTHHRSESAASHKRIRFDGVEVPTYQQILEREHNRTPLLAVRDKPITQSLPELSDDYDSWEAGLDISDLRNLQYDNVSGESLHATHICDLN